MLSQTATPIFTLSSRAFAIAAFTIEFASAKLRGIWSPFGTRVSRVLRSNVFRDWVSSRQGILSGRNLFRWSCLRHWALPHSDRNAISSVHFCCSESKLNKLVIREMPAEASSGA
jgi:hypothetical protein